MSNGKLNTLSIVPILEQSTRAWACRSLLGNNR